MPGRKLAVVVLSDPKPGSEEALGRIFNALAAAHDWDSRGGDVKIVFQGAGTRWPAELAKPAHPAHGLYEQLADKVAGASCGCAEAFGAAESARACGVPLLRQADLPGTSGVTSYWSLADAGYDIVTF